MVWRTVTHVGDKLYMSSFLIDQSLPSSDQDMTLGSEMCVCSLKLLLGSAVTLHNTA